MNDHTYLFEEATWDVEGIFSDAEGNSFPLEGAITVAHGDEHWTLTGNMEVHSDPPLTIENHYQVVPFAADRFETSWTSFNPELGELEGRVSVVEDTLFAMFQSSDGSLYGSEVLVQIDADSYENRGLLYQEGQLISSWAASLSRATPGVLH